MTEWPLPPVYSLVQATERLPPRAQRKLADLEALAADAEMLARALQDRIRKQELKCSEIAHRRDRALATRNAEALAGLDRDLAGAIASLDKHRRDLNTRNSHAANTAQTLGVLRNFVQALVSGLGELVPPQPARLPPLQRPNETVLDALERTRREIGGAGSELARVKTAPLPVKEIKAQIAAQVDAMARAGAPRVAMKTATEVAVSWPDLPPVQIADAPVYAPGAASKLMCWLHRDRIVAELCADLPADSSHVIPSADRPGKLREIEAKLYALELVEELLVMAAQAANLDVQRRVNASPWAILFASDGEEQFAEAAE